MPRTPQRTAATPPPLSAAAAVVPAATPGATLKSVARARVSSAAQSMPCRWSCRAQMRSRTCSGGWPNSSANIMRRNRLRRMTGALLVVHSVGVGACSSSRFMNTFEPPVRSRWRGRPNGRRAPKSKSWPSSRSSISSNNRMADLFPDTSRCARRSSCNRSRRDGSSPSSSVSPTL